jgi:glycosyltransferase involved in cell wall biosynthesis
MYLSVISPVYNEHDNISLLYEEMIKALKDIGKDWEFILVDDGSVDGSMDELQKLAQRDPIHVKVVSLRRNFGQTAAIAAGVDHSSGEIIVLIDADLQNDPADIPMMLEKIEEGYDLVSGWRKARQDNQSRKIPSRIANKIIGRVTGVKLHDYGCTLKAYRREVITGFRLYGEMHRFIPAYAKTYGAKMIEVEVQHHPRRFGKPKYGLERTLKVVLDLFTVKFLSSYSDKPIYMFGGSGLALSAAGSLLLLILAVRRLGWGISVVQSPLFSISIMIFILGFILIMMGLLAEMLMRSYYESQGKRTYTVKKLVNFNLES